MKVLTNLDLGKSQLQNAALHPLAAAPGSPVEGQVYYNTTGGNKKLYVWNGTAWIDLTAAQSFAIPSHTISAGDTAAAGSATTGIRSDAVFGINTGPASTVSGSNAEGTSTNLARADHNHALGSGVVDVAQLAAGVKLNTINAPTGSVAFNAQKATGLADPTAAQDAATKQYVDAAVQGLSPKSSARLATTAALPANTYANGAAGVGATLTANANGALSVDSTAVAVGDRILVKDEAATANNGIYTVTAAGGAGAPYVLTRATDMDQATEIIGAYVFVEAGTTNVSSGWVVNAPTQGTAVTVGTTGVTWTQFSGAGEVVAGNGLSKAGNTLTVVGTANRVSVSGAGVDIASTYVGQATITTLGTIGTGTWQGTAVGVGFGGTGSGTAAGARTNLGAPGLYNSGNIGDGVATSFTITHNLNNANPVVHVYESGASGEKVYPNITKIGANSVSVAFTTAPATNAYTVTVVG